MLWCDSVAPLGNPVVPLVYWMLIGSSNDRLASRSVSGSAWPPRPRPRRRASGLEQRVPLLRAEVDHVLQVRHVGPDLVDHAVVVARLEALRTDQHPHARLPQREAELVTAIGRIDVDQDDPGLSRRVLELNPLGAVGRPDSQPVTRSQAGRYQAPGQRVGIGVEVRVGPPAAGRRIDQRLGAGVRGGNASEVIADRLAEQRDAGRAVAVGQRDFGGHDRIPSPVDAPIVPVMPVGVKLSRRPRKKKTCYWHQAGLG